MSYILPFSYDLHYYFISHIEHTSPCHNAIISDGEEDLEWPGFKLVGDKIDKNIKPRDMRFSSQTTSLHYFHLYAVKDRINFKHLSGSATMISHSDIDLSLFSPSAEDNEHLVTNLKL